ncbi:bifunctional diaminohydroxyphosphoribosylaminopyrimidine deaminase/5-amino-6-(5-phosphoribosylamino)uracil reductase RibD [Thermodesulfobacteriota bacterium]
MDDKFMREALRQARRGLGRTSPNPAVGAVIVKEGKVVAKGYHHRAGMPHAEIEALEKAQESAHGATLYVTLEPCNHHGKTPPCTVAILKSGINRVVVGMRDPNPTVSGGGCEFLKSKGVVVDTGIMEKECRKLNEAFVKFVTTKKPFVVMKSAMTLDGYTATAKGHSKWITNEKSRQFVHRLRDRADAVLVGVGTVISDNPKLTSRLKKGKGKDALRVILDTHLRISPDAALLQQESSASTMIAAGPDVDQERFRRFSANGVSVHICPLKGGMIDLDDLLNILGNMDISYLLVEGGATVAGSFIRGSLIDKFYLFKAPKILGGEDGLPMASGKSPDRIDEGLTLKDVEIRRFGDDTLIVGYPDYGD